MAFTMRPPTEADLPRLVELSREESLASGRDHTLTEDAIREEWSAPHQDVVRFNRVVEAGGVVVGNANIWLETPMAWLGGYVTPSHRRAGIGAALYAWAMDTIPTIEGLTHIHLGHQGDDTDGARFVEALEGVRHERSFLRMRNEAPHLVEKPSFGDGIELYGPADPVAEMIRLRNLTFQDHWNYVPWTEEDLARSIESGENDPSLWYFASIGGEPAGMCRNQLRPDHTGVQRGYLGPIGTVRSARGRGVARALLRHSIAELVARDAATVTLWVDSRNPFEATKLYETNGFTVRGEWRVFRKDL
jgi:ribosomal protein S18 acetylase RimI-like enzyme